MIADYKYNGFTEAEKEEIKEELDLLLSLIHGTVPMARNLGIDPDILDNGMVDGGNAIIAELMDKIEMLDKRIVVKQIILKKNTEGGIYASIAIDRRKR